MTNNLIPSLRALAKKHPPTVRSAARMRQPLDGADAQALEGALSVTEKERNKAQAEVERLQAENEKLRNERDALRKIILDAAYDAEWCDKKIHLVDSHESYQNWRLVVYLPVPCNVTDKEIESALDRAVANNSKL